MASDFSLKDPARSSAARGSRHSQHQSIDLSQSMVESGNAFGDPPRARPSWLQRQWTFFCGTPCRAMLGCGTIVLLGLIIFVPIILLVIVPIVVNMFVNATTMTIISATLMEPLPSTMLIDTWVELNNAGPIAAKLSGFNATLVGPKGRDIGWLVFPDVPLDANSANLQDVLSQMTIMNEQAIYEEGLDLLAGRPVTWRIKGETTLTTLGFGFKVDIDKPLTFPGVLLENFQTRNVRINYANASYDDNGHSGMIVMDADLEFSSSSILQFDRIGMLRADLWYNKDANDAEKWGFSKVFRELHGSRLCTPEMNANNKCCKPEDQDEDGVCKEGVEVWKEVSENIGWCDMYDFKVLRGVNRVKASIFLYNSETNGYNLGRWVSQWEQTIISVGPTNKFFLNKVWQGLVTLEAGPTKMFTGGLVDKQTLVQGYDLETGQNCGLTTSSAETCNRGSIISGVNPFVREWALKDISYDVYFDEKIEYDAKFVINALGNTLSVPAVDIQCAASDTFARMQTRPGMLAYTPNNDPRVEGGPSSGFAVDGYRKNTIGGQDATMLKCISREDPGSATDGECEGLDDLLSDQTIPLPKGSTNGTGTYTFFLTATPFPGRAETINTGAHGIDPCVLGIDSLVSFDCCLMTVTTAAACKAEQKGKKHIDVISRGNATMIVDGMDMIVYPVVKLPLSYTEEVVEFDALAETSAVLSAVAKAGFNCDEIKWTGVTAEEACAPNGWGSPCSCCEYDPAINCAEAC